MSDHYGDYDKLPPSGGQEYPIGQPDKGKNPKVFTSLEDPSQVSVASLKVFGSTSDLPTNSSMLSNNGHLDEHKIKYNSKSDGKPDSDSHLKPNSIAKSIYPNIVDVADIIIVGIIVINSLCVHNKTA